jgi:uncharacterized spore protein YtfJ
MVPGRGSLTPTKRVGAIHFALFVEPRCQWWENDYPFGSASGRYRDPSRVRELVEMREAVMTQVDAALSRLDAIRDLLTVKQVFGEMYERDGVTVIPVAAVRGGGGGGGGEGTDSQRQGQGTGSGVGFGVNIRPAGAFVVRDGDVTWMPAIDVTRIVLGGQLVAAVGLLLLRQVLRRRRI